MISGVSSRRRALGVRSSRAVAPRTSRGTSKTGVYDQFQAKLTHRGRSGHAELCLCVLNETTQVSCAEFLIRCCCEKQALLRASTKRLQSLVAADPRSQRRPPNFGGQRNCPMRDPSVTPFMCWSERQHCHWCSSQRSGHTLVPKQV